MLILYGVKSAGSLEKTTSIEIGRGFPYPFLILPLRLDSIRSIGVRQRFARGMIYIQSGYTGWIGTLRKGVVFQVSREKKREDRGGEGSGGGGIIDGGTQRVVRRVRWGEEPIWLPIRVLPSAHVFTARWRWRVNQRGCISLRLLFSLPYPPLVHPTLYHIIELRTPSASSSSSYGFSFFATVSFSNAFLPRPDRRTFSTIDITNPSRPFSIPTFTTLRRINGLYLTAFGNGWLRGCIYIYTYKGPEIHRLGPVINE